ncbi:hypothetical protein B0H19DRAFT_1081579 [Mycena capillaripes]|nr:hypothetical protein B0H19DRAFT_1081579 [Mycena capillaripes]
MSLGRGQLTFFDGQFTLTVAHSPITWYILWINIREIYWWWMAQTEKVHMETVLCFAIVGGWISVNLVVWFKGRNIPGEDCGTMNFKTYFVLVVLTGSTPGLSSFGGPVVFGIGGGLLALCLLVYSSRSVSMDRRSNSATFGSGMLRIFRFIRFTLTHHKWLIYTTVIYSYISWAILLVVWTVEPDYDFTYGQALSALSAVPSVISLLKFLRGLKKEDIAAGIRCFLSDIIFLCFGDGQRAMHINEKYFDNKLQLPSLPGELYSLLPFTHPVAGSDAHSTTIVPSGRPSSHIADTQEEGPFELPLHVAENAHMHLTGRAPSTEHAELGEIPRSASPVEISTSELQSAALADEAVSPEDEIAPLAKTSGIEQNERPANHKPIGFVIGDPHVPDSQPSSREGESNPSPTTMKQEERQDR